MNFDDNFELFSHLPRASQNKIRRLLDDRERAHEALLAAWQRLNHEREELARAKIIVASQEQAAAHGARRIGLVVTMEEAMAYRLAEGTEVPPRSRLTDDDIAQQNDQIQIAEDRVERALSAQEAAAAEWEKFTYLDEAVRWLRTYLGHDGRLAHQPLPDVKLQRGETPRAAVERVRKQIEAIDAQWQRVDDAPAPAAELKNRITAQVDALAESGRPTIRAGERVADPAGLSSLLRIRAVEGRPIADGAAPFLAWLHRDEIIERLHLQVDELDLTGAMTDDERASAFSHLLDQRLALAFDEEAFVVAAAEEGTTVPRRRDADPRAILQVREVFSAEFSDRAGHVAISDEKRPARGSAPVKSEAGR